MGVGPVLMYKTRVFFTMNISIFPVISLIASLAKIGANITDNQKKLLEWRFSEEGRKHYSDEENNNLYKAIEKGNTGLIDTIRKEKQRIIADLLKSLSLIFLCLFIVSCSTYQKITSPVHLDTASLLETEKTYQLEKQNVQTSDGLKVFDGSWYVVHKDVIKMMNDNQDLLIRQLENNKKLQLEMKKQTIMFGIAISLSSLIILVLLMSFFIRKKR
jgi:hypothetical protein